MFQPIINQKLLIFLLFIKFCFETDCLLLLRDVVFTQNGLRYVNKKMTTEKGFLFEITRGQL